MYDEETGMYYLRSRYYNPDWSRFINADQYIDLNHSILRENIFSYCGNIPIAFSDDSGKLFLSALIFIGIGALVGAGTGALTALCDGGNADDILEGTFEGLLTGTASAAIGYFVPYPLLAAGTGFLAGGVIDAGTQVGTYCIENDTLDGFEWNHERTLETAITTGIGSGIPTYKGTNYAADIAFDSAVVAANVSLAVSTGVVTYRGMHKNTVIAMEK